MNASIIRLAIAGLFSLALSACNPPDAPIAPAATVTEPAPTSAPTETPAESVTPAAAIAPAPSIMPARALTDSLHCEADRETPAHTPTLFEPRDPRYRAPVGEESAHKGPPSLMPGLPSPVTPVTGGP